MSGHDEDDIVDDAFGSWMMTKQGLALYQSDGDQVVRPPPQADFISQLLKNLSFVVISNL